MSDYRIFVTCDIGEESLRRLRDRGYEVEVYEREDAPPRELILEKVRSGIDGLLTTLRDRVDKEVLEAGKDTLKVIAQYGVGFDNIDRDAANRFRIPFTNTPDVLTDATAEFALFMLGSAARRLYSSERLVREDKWDRWHPGGPLLGDEVTGKVIGVIGAGRIGRSFILKCAGLDVDFLYFNRSEQKEFATAVQRVLDAQHTAGLVRRRREIRFVTLQECLQASDFVSIHLPLNEQTRGMIDEGALRLMKRTGYLINTARGPIVDERALYRALKEGWIAGAALDVFETEPLPADSPLRDPDLEERLRLFSHMGSAAGRTRLSPDPEVGMAGRCVQGMIDLLEGNYGGNPAEVPLVVNKEAFR